MNVKPMDLNVVLEIKQQRLKELESIIKALETPNPTIEVSYTLNLTKQEQIYYAKLGAYSLWYDIQNYTK